MSDLKIVAAEIREENPLPGWPGPGVCTVYVTLEDETQLKAFAYYPDELTFTAADFIGSTLQEAYELRHKRDVAYLRS